MIVLRKIPFCFFLFTYLAIGSSENNLSDEMIYLLEQTERNTFSDRNTRKSFVDYCDKLIEKITECFAKENAIDNTATKNNECADFFNFLMLIKKFEEKIGEIFDIEVLNGIKDIKYTKMIPSIRKMILSMKDSKFVEFINIQNRSNRLLRGVNIREILNILISDGFIDISYENRKYIQRSVEFLTKSFTEWLAFGEEYYIYDKIKYIKGNNAQRHEKEHAESEINKVQARILANFKEYFEILRKFQTNKVKITPPNSRLDFIPGNEEVIINQEDLEASSFLIADLENIFEIKRLKIIISAGKKISPLGIKGRENISKIFDFSRLESLVVNQDIFCAEREDGFRKQMRLKNSEEVLYILKEIPINKIAELNIQFLDSRSLQRILEKTQELRKLELGHIDCMKEENAIPILLERISSFSNLEEITMANFNIKTVDFINILRSLRNPSKIKSLGIIEMENLFDKNPEAFMELIKALSKMNNIEIIELSRNQLKELHLLSVIESIQNKENFKFLGMESNMVSFDLEFHSKLKKELVKFKKFDLIDLRFNMPPKLKENTQTKSSYRIRNTVIYI